jgi:hypothetical protein
MNAFRLLRRQIMDVAGKRQRSRLGQAHTSSCGVGLFLLRDTIPLQFNRRLRCPLAVSYYAAVGTIR